MSEGFGRAEEDAPLAEPEPSVPRPRRRWPSLAATLFVVGAAAMWIRYEAQPRERDYHAVRAEFLRIAREIRNHDQGMWVVVEGPRQDQGSSAAAQEDHQRRVLADFELISHLQGFVMSEVQIEIDGDRARLRYRLQASPEPGKPAPGGGQMDFVRKDGQWVLEDHRFTTDQ